LLNNIKLSAACDINNTVFAITDNDWKYLHYFKFINQFDTIGVNYTAGEFQIVNGINKTRLYINNLNPNTNYFLEGDSIQGEDSVLLTKSRTNSFMYQQGSQISFLE